MHFGHLVRSIWKKYSLLRAYENDFVKNLNLSGEGIDLGAKSKDAKYYEYLDLTQVEHMDFVDYFHAGDGVIQMDLENPFPLHDEKYDFVLLFNVMEHIFDYENLLSEARRILRKEGAIYGLVPMMWHFHPDPNDYFRFTEQALKRILEEAGMDNIVVRPIAYGPFKVAASQVGHAIKFRVVKLPIYVLGIVMDKIFSMVSSGTHKYALAYYFSGVKSDLKK